jgi:hypothetical protein
MGIHWLSDVCSPQPQFPRPCFGNSIIHGTAQLSRFAGPILAGVLITLLGGWNASLTAGADQPPDLMGLGTLLDLTR